MKNQYSSVYIHIFWYPFIPECCRLSFVPFVAFSVIGARANLVRGTFLYSVRICDFGLILWLGLGLGLFFLCTLLLSLLVPSIKNRIPIQVKGIKIVSFKKKYFSKQ